jgi:hypothetical protein
LTGKSERSAEEQGPFKISWFHQIWTLNPALTFQALITSKHRQKNTLCSPDQILPTKSRANPEGWQNDDSEVGNELDDATLFIFKSQTHRRTHRLLTRGIPADRSTVFSLNHQTESDKGFSLFFRSNQFGTVERI